MVNQSSVGDLDFSANGMLGQPSHVIAVTSSATSNEQRFLLAKDFLQFLRGEETQRTDVTTFATDDIFSHLLSINTLTYIANPYGLFIQKLYGTKKRDRKRKTNVSNIRNKNGGQGVPYICV